MRPDAVDNVTFMFTENTSLIWWQRPRSRLGYDRSLLYRVEYFSEWHEVQWLRNAAVVLRQVVRVIVYTVVTLLVERQERHPTCKKISFRNSPPLNAGCDLAGGFSL